jgi:hypothetical protein
VALSVAIPINTKPNSSVQPDRPLDSTSHAHAYADGRDFRFPTTAPGRLSFAEGNSSVHPEEQPEGGTI